MLCTHSSPTLEISAFKKEERAEARVFVAFDLARCGAWYPQQTWLSLVVLRKLLNLA